MREFGQVITDPIFLAAAIEGGRMPWVEPTELQPIPTDAEMQNWYPDEAPEKCRYRLEVNVSTGERKYIELTLDEYRQRHVAKIESRNQHVLRKRYEARAASRKAKLEALLDKIEIDPTILDRII